MEFCYNAAQLCGCSGEEGKIPFTERRQENLDGLYASACMENGHDSNFVDINLKEKNPSQDQI